MDNPETSTNPDILTKPEILATHEVSTTPNTLTTPDTKQHEFAQELVKQMITLSTGVLALTITFQKDLIGSTDVSYATKKWLFTSWVLFLLSILCGLISMMGLTGTVIRKKSATSKAATIPATLQILFFFLGVLASVIFGYTILFP